MQQTVSLKQAEELIATVGKEVNGSPTRSARNW
jgi:hypothetical protein